MRVADEAWDDPLDPSWAQALGGRWNPPGSFLVLYLNADLATARAQVTRLLDGWPLEPEDLDPPWVLIVATLPSRQRVADAVSDEGLAALGLPATYPRDLAGAEVGHDRCRPVGVAVHDTGLRGVWCRSAATPGGDGRELAWFPARPTSRAVPVGRPVAFDRWWRADDVGELLDG